MSADTFQVLRKPRTGGLTSSEGTRKVTLRANGEAETCRERRSQQGERGEGEVSS